MKTSKTQLAIVALILSTLIGFATPEQAHASEENSNSKDSKTNNEKVEEKLCTPAREYITALEYIRSAKDLIIPEAEAQNIALQVSKGCTGSAKRYVKVSSTLSRSGLLGKNTNSIALDFVQRSDAETDTFLTVFIYSFSSDYLDLDIQSSLLLARSLVDDFHGDVKDVADDFKKIVQFCTSEKYLSLPRPKCAPFSARVARLGEKWGGKISEPFIKTFEFLRSEKGPNVTPEKAVELAELIVSQGKTTPENFIQAYKYAASSSGLKAGTQEALQFAKKLTLQSGS